MWAMSVWLITAGVRFSTVSILSTCVVLLCLAVDPLQMNTSNLAVMDHSKVAQEETNDTNVQRGHGSEIQDSTMLLKRLAQEQIVTDDKFLGKTRFSIDQQTHALFYDLSQVPPSVVLSSRDPYATPLEALLRTASLRRDFERAIPNDRFWTVPLDSVEQAVQVCVRSFQVLQSTQDGIAHQQECSKNIEEQFDKLRTSILTYAAASGLQVSQRQGTRDPVMGYPVQIKIEPPQARLKVMTLLEYKKYQYSKTPKERYQWNDLLDSENDMIGWYHFRAEWPAELGGPEEGDFEIRKPSTITFRPIQK